MKLTLKRLRTGTPNKIAFEVPENENIQEQLRKIFLKAKENNDYLTVDVSLPGKPRTTGKYSQNHHLNGHCVQIAAETGNDFETVKMAVKMMAVGRDGWRYKSIAGHIVPISEALSTTTECACAIECAHQLAAELGIVLREGN